MRMMMHRGGDGGYAHRKTKVGQMSVANAAAVHATLARQHGSPQRATGQGLQSMSEPNSGSGESRGTRGGPGRPLACSKGMAGPSPRRPIRCPPATHERQLKGRRLIAAAPAHRAAGPAPERWCSAASSLQRPPGVNRGSGSPGGGGTGCKFDCGREPLPHEGAARMVRAARSTGGRQFEFQLLTGWLPALQSQGLLPVQG